MSARRTQAPVPAPAPAPAQAPAQAPRATFIWIIIYFTAGRVRVHPKGVANKLCKRLKPPDILKCCRINQRRDFMFHLAIAQSQLDFANWPN